MKGEGPLMESDALWEDADTDLRWAEDSFPLCDILEVSKFSPQSFLNSAAMKMMETKEWIDKLAFIKI